MRKITKEEAIKLATKDYYLNKKHNYVFNVPKRPEMGCNYARRKSEIAGRGIREVWDTSKLWKPLPMKTPLVVASFDGVKTETRQLLKTSDHRKIDESRELGPFFGQPVVMKSGHVAVSGNVEDGHGLPFYVHPKSEAGDLLYARERWQGYTEYDSYDDLPTTPPAIAWWHEIEKAERDNFRFHFTFPDYQLDKYLRGSFTQWLPSIHMPKKASRLWLEVVNCYPQFLQDITGDQCLAEGITAYPEIYNEFKDTAVYDTADELHRQVFFYLWDMINGHRGGAKSEDNPLVWTTEYKRVDYGPFLDGGK